MGPFLHRCFGQIFSESHNNVHSVMRLRSSILVPPPLEWGVSSHWWVMHFLLPAHSKVGAGRLCRTLCVRLPERRGVLRR